MKAKIIAIIIMTLLIATALSAIGVTIKTIGNENSTPLSNGSVDQEQTTSDGWGEGLHPPFVIAQSFKPAMENLTAVQLWFFKHLNPPAGVEITVSIRDSLNGSDLTAKTINADNVGIKKSGTWVFFNFEDITVIPEETYYIVCSGSKGDANGCYCWYFDLNDKYSRGEAWYSNDSGVSWITLEEAYYPELPEPDFCFKTYFKQSRDKSINTSFLQFLENHPNLLRLIGKLLQRFGL